MKFPMYNILKWIKHSSVAVLIFIINTPVKATYHINSDTLKLPLPEVEKIFMEKNLSLLASKYQIESNKALIEQAKLWDNPMLITDQNVYSNNHFFEHGKDAAGQIRGTYFIQIQQLIKTAGKRSKLVNLATTSSKVSELQFLEVMRNLKYQLRSDYYSIAQLIAVHNLYNNEIAILNKLLIGMNSQLQAGNIAKKEYLRIQALIISLQQDLTESDKQLADVEMEIKNLLQMTNNDFIAPINISKETELKNFAIESLLEDAKKNNSAYLIEQTQLLYQQQNLIYQKALKSPDLTIGPEYDHNSSYTPRYLGFSISLPLNILNKNQGNIKSAQANIKQEETILLNTELQLKNAVQNSLNKLIATFKLSESSQKEFYTNYELLYNNIAESYKQRQISLIEFIDFFDAYKDVQLKLFQQKLNLQLAKEEMNYQIGKDVTN